MATDETSSESYPEYDESGARNPIRLPVTEESAQWEKEAALDIEAMEQSGNPGSF